ncbi:MAG: dTDP-glucose 4,6-dehydratase [Paramuribaculum sp.]|nr:dTDP-glucose 4,6-dehydratase [Paramuribaculum sp.]
MKQKKYFITGGAGFIGANFVKYLIASYGNDVEVLIADSLTYAANLDTIATELGRDNVSLLKADIRDADAMEQALKDFNPDYMVNFAAETHVDRSVTGPRIFVETNVLGTHTLLEAARKAWGRGVGKDGDYVYAPGKRFLQISTDEVYGSLEKNCPDGMPIDMLAGLDRVVSGRERPVAYGTEFFTEVSPLSPRSPYSASKTSADLMVMAYFHTYKLPVNITRCSNNYGPYQFPEKLIPLVINNLMEGKKLPVYGAGENVRDWLYVEDHARAVDMVLNNGRPGEIYNVGGFNERRNIDIVKLIIDIVKEAVSENKAYCELLKTMPEHLTYDLIEYVRDRPGHDMRYAINPAKIAAELGWYPTVTFREGIVRTVRWYLDNPEWIKKVTSGEYRNYYQSMYEGKKL